MLPARLLLATLGGVALFLSFPGYDVWPLAMVGVGCLALATTGARVRVGALAGLLLGLAWYTPMFVWASTYAGVMPWVAMSVASALYPAAMGGVLAWLQRGGRVRPLAGALAWTVMEWGRAETPFGGFPWARLGFSQADAPVLGVVSLVGVPGLGLVVALVGGLLAVAAAAALAPGPRPRRPQVALGAAALALALTLAPALLPRPTEGAPLAVAAVQSDMPEGFTRTLTAEPGALLERNVERTAALADDVAAGRARQPDVVLWPEGASDRDPLHPERGEATTRQITATVEAVGAPIVLGATSRAGGVPPAAPRNMMFAYLPGRGLVDSYQKVYLAPFGEQMPLRPLMRHLSPWVDRMVDFAPGSEVGTMTVPLRSGGEVVLGLGVCFEVVVDEAMRDVVVDGAELLVVPTSNAWFGEGDEAVQQLAASRVRAVEHGRSLVHVSNVGVSALITPDGVAHQESGLFTEALLQGELPLRTARTPAVTTGPWVEPLAALALAVACLVPARRPVRVAR